MKIIVAGNWRADIHERSLSDGFEKLGWHTVPFIWNTYFIEHNWIKSLGSKLQYKYNIGPKVRKINEDLIKMCRVEKPEVLFCYRPNFISKETIIEIKREHPRIKITSYNNDDPFSNEYPHYFWKRHLQASTSYDVVFAYRPKNVDDYLSLGCKKVVLLPPWYVDDAVKQISRRNLQYDYDVVFVGHYENDGRLELIKKINKRKHISFGLFGPEWNRVIKADKYLRHLYPVKQLNTEEYFDVLSRSKICLAIYSSLNNDVYTRRCFEIPATGSFLLGQYTKEMSAILEAEKDCSLFHSYDDALRKIESYINHPSLLHKISESGHKRIINDGNDAKARAKTIIDALESITVV